jgi:hypothetical protein
LISEPISRLREFLNPHVHFAPNCSSCHSASGSFARICGARAANDLDAFIDRQVVDCVPVSLDQYGRTVASCSIGGVDLGDWLVRNGFALDWPQYSKGKYDAAQRVMPSLLAVGFGRAAMWHRGYIELASGQAGVPTRVPMMQTLIPERVHPVLSPATEPDRAVLLHEMIRR